MGEGNEGLEGIVTGKSTKLSMGRKWWKTSQTKEERRYMKENKGAMEYQCIREKSGQRTKWAGKKGERKKLER